MSRLKSLLGVYLLGVAAATIGCRSVESTISEEVLEEYVVYDPGDNFVSIDDVIRESCKFNPDDPRSIEISHLAVNRLGRIEAELMQKNHGVVSARVKELAEELDGMNHPLAGLLSREVKDMEYATKLRLNKRTNVLRSGLRKMYSRSGAGNVLLYAFFTPVFVLFEAGLIPVQLFQLCFGEGPYGRLGALKVDVEDSKVYRVLRYSPYKRKITIEMEEDE